MAAPNLASAFSIGIDVLKTVVDAATKTILAQTGDVLSEQPESDRVEWWQHVGFLSRPPKPSPGKKAAQAVVLRRSDHDIALASRDLRGQELAGAIGDGETCLYAAGPDGEGQARMLLKGNGTVALVTTHDNTKDGKTVGIFVEGEAIKIVNRYGMIVLDSSGIQFVTFGNQATPDVPMGGSAVKLNNLPLSAASVQIATGQFQAYSDTVFLGKLATPVTNATWSPNIPMVSIPSISVFMAP